MARFLSCGTSDLSHPVLAKNQGRIAGDLGITAMAMLSDGRVLEAPKPHRKMFGRLEKKQQAAPGSKNHLSLAMLIARFHKHIADARSAPLPF